MENESKPIEDNEGTEFVTKDGSCRKVDASRIKMVKYVDLMSECFTEATKLLQRQGLNKLTLVISDTARALFNACTRELSTEKLYTKALECLGTVMEDNEDAGAPLEYRPSVPNCKHETLRALWAVLDGKPYMDEVIDSLIAVRPPHNDINTPCLLCPECRRLLSAEKIKSGLLWDSTT